MGVKLIGIHLVANQSRVTHIYFAAIISITIMVKYKLKMHLEAKELAASHFIIIPT